jgi:hypothetical protein
MDALELLVDSRQLKANAMIARSTQVTVYGTQEGNDKILGVSQCISKCSQSLPTYSHGYSWGTG